MKKRKILFAIMTASLVMVGCQKEALVLQELNAQQFTKKYTSEEPLALVPEMVDNKTLIFSFNYEYFNDIVNDLDHKYFGESYGETIYGRLEKFDLKQIWINDFMVEDQEVFKSGETFSTIFESAVLSYDFGNQSRILAIQNSLVAESIYDLLVFDVQPFDLRDALEVGTLTLKLTLKENPTETRYFNYNFSIGCIVDGIYLKE